MSRRKICTEPTQSGTERAILVQLRMGSSPPHSQDESLAELARLADTAGMEVLGHITQRRDRASPALLIGKGKAEEVAAVCRRWHGNTVVFDNDLTPVQASNLTDLLESRVIDRTEVILQIFARRARTAEARVQVELAQLEYLVSRVQVVQKQHRFTGGIGMRGPGESPLEMRKTSIRRRIRDLRKRLDNIQKRRELTRPRGVWPQVCLVGYTNAGKSTLLNALAASSEYVDDKLFATLDTRRRRVRLESGATVLLSDTVGFVRNLPHGLVASFRSTLDVATLADLLLVVVDASHPAMHEHMDVIDETLNGIGAQKVPSLLVFNKWDGVQDATEQYRLLEEYPDAICISALKGAGLGRLQKEIAGHVEHCRHADRKP